MRRIAVLSAAVAVLLPAAGLAAPGPRFAMPPKAAQGQLVTLAVAVKSGVRCFLVVRFADNATESPGGAFSRNGKVTWHWRVAPTAAIGTARATVSCGKAGSATRTFAVVGSLLKPKIVIEKQGYSQRNSVLGGSTVSYGIMLHNPSPQQDALNTFVLVNFVDATDHVLGTASRTVALIPAGSTFALGDSMSLRASIPVARLEITIVGKSAQPRAQRPMPSLQHVFIAPSAFEPGWVGEVDGEIVNDSQTRTLQSTELSVVLLDAAGQVVGGGTGMTFTSVPAGARAVFLAQQGFNAVPMARAAQAVISISPTYLG